MPDVAAASPRLLPVPAFIALAVAAIAGLPSSAAAGPDATAEAGRLAAAFEAQTGARLVFVRGDLPAGAWFEGTPPLTAARRVAAARILLAESRHYPRGWLGAIGLRTVGVFDALVSAKGDGYRPYDDDHGGYLYYGLWNGRDAIAAAFYGPGQLPLTFHHEVFHHVDATRAGTTDRGRFYGEDDAGFAAAVAGQQRYPGLVIGAADRDRLAAARAAAGDDDADLVDAVGAYASKAAGEDQAETARWLMAHLAAGLLQAAERPELAGSQRILHVLAAYRTASPAAAPGPDVAWLIDLAVGRDPVAGRAARFASAADAAVAALRGRIAPQGEPSFVVWGREGADGGNPTLRADLGRFGEHARAVAAATGRAGVSATDLARAELRILGLLARYHRFIAARWSLSPGTIAGFDRARARIVATLPAPLRDRVAALALPALAARISVEGELGAAPAPARPRPAPRPRPANRYLGKVDAEIADPAWRAAIRAVQPATVKLGGGSGVNLAARGVILTAAHVADKVGARLDVRFPDGTARAGTCTALDADLDLALVTLDAVAGGASLPWAPLAAAAPAVGDAVAIVGQPGRRTPDGEATGYQPWHVSVGAIRGFRAGDRRGPQHLGRTKHDAWTYWGHSGSPLFDRHGAIVALHNSWDSATAMRHAVTWEAITSFVKARAPSSVSAGATPVP